MDIQTQVQSALDGLDPEILPKIKDKLDVDGIAHSVRLILAHQPGEDIASVIGRQIQYRIDEIRGLRIQKAHYIRAKRLFHKIRGNKDESFYDVDITDLRLFMRGVNTFNKKSSIKNQDFFKHLTLSFQMLIKFYGAPIISGTVAYMKASNIANAKPVQVKISTVSRDGTVRLLDAPEGKSVKASYSTINFISKEEFDQSRNNS